MSNPLPSVSMVILIPYDSPSFIVRLVGLNIHPTHLNRNVPAIASDKRAAISRGRNTMTRVRADDYEAKRQPILDKAATLIARKGFDVATVMHDIKFPPKALLGQSRRMEADLKEQMEGLLREINPEFMAEERLQKSFSLLLFGMMIWTFSWYCRTASTTPDPLAHRISTLFIHGFKALPLETE